MSTVDELLERRYRVIGKNSPLFYERPLHLVRGEGVWLWDADGRRYLDTYNSVPHVGHCHPHVVEAIAKQAGGPVRTLVLPECGHSPQRDAPEATRDAIVDFLSAR